MEAGPRSAYQRAEIHEEVCREGFNVELLDIEDAAIRLREMMDKQDR